MNELIQYKDISLSVQGRVLFDRFNLTISRGDKILLTGKSGAGKSSLIKMFLGFSGYDQGDIYFEGKRVKRHDFSRVRHRIAYVNQDVTLRKGSIQEVLRELEGYKHSSFKYTGEYGLEPTLMELMEFDPALLKKKTEELSGGERQRLGLIIAMMLDRDIYLLDEVTSSLDKNLKEKVARYFARVDGTVLTISHDSVWEEDDRFMKVVW